MKLLLIGATWATALGALAQAPTLIPSQRLDERIVKSAEENATSHVLGESVQATGNDTLTIQGAAEFRRLGAVVQADRVDYSRETDQVRAVGNVRLERKGDVFVGTDLVLEVEQYKGHFLNPSYKLLSTGANGTGERLDFLDSHHTVIHKASYSTCRRVPGIEWLPDWVLSATRIEMDTQEDVGYAHDAVLRFQNVPILALPSASFPLGNGRKTGFLTPSYSTDSLNGFEVTTPYYINVAPNRDATLYPSVNSKRGVNLGAEVRYLEPKYAGQFRVDIMPKDALRDRSRWGLAAQHQQHFETDAGRVGLTWGVNRVSDDNYWRDFPSAYGTLNQRLLPSEMSIDWAQGNWSTSLRATQWQVLQDVTAPITPPYNRLPQWTINYGRSNWGGFNLGFETQVTRFTGDAAISDRVNSTRAVVVSQLSYPLSTPGAFVTPKVIMYNSAYQFADTVKRASGRAQVSVPTYSLDAGLVFDRKSHLLGRDFVQTLEPRIFYVYTPYREQSQFPNYDSAARDFNFASLFTENPYSGYSRVADSNLLTLGVTSRLLDDLSGVEMARFGLAQRFRFATQKVTLPGGSPDAEQLSDLLIGGAVNLNPHWSLDFTQQMRPSDFRSTRFSTGARYSPQPLKVINGAYRYQKDVSEQMEVSWQWPVAHIFGRPEPTTDALGASWYTVGRLNFSVTERKLVDSVIGFEYDAGCWIGRIVLENLTRSDATTTKRVLFQLDLLGFTSLGSGATKTLRTAIPRYQSLRETAQSPNRFSNYE